MHGKMSGVKYNIRHRERENLSSSGPPGQSSPLGTGGHRAAIGLQGSWEGQFSCVGSGAGRMVS